jgi:hypothetical protein
MGTALLTLPMFVAIIVQPVLIGPKIGEPWGPPNPTATKAAIPNLMVGIDNLLVDMCIAYIPIPVLAKLNLSKSKKRGVIVLFAAGTM